MPDWSQYSVSACCECWGTFVSPNANFHRTFHYVGRASVNFKCMQWLCCVHFWEAFSRFPNFFRTWTHSRRPLIIVTYCWYGRFITWTTESKNWLSCHVYVWWCRTRTLSLYQLKQSTVYYPVWVPYQTSGTKVWFRFASFEVMMVWQK